jgi:hypothetical protein
VLDQEHDVRVTIARFPLHVVSGMVCHVVKKWVPKKCIFCKSGKNEIAKNGFFFVPEKF